MAAHESQSLFQEMQLSRRREFWEFALAEGARHLGPFRGCRGRGHAGPCAPRRARIDPCRCRRGDLSAACDPALRDRAGPDSGKLAAKDVPEAWDAKMRDYLGSRPSTIFKDGPMQDVHWPSGAFGYFPSYTLGAMMAAQQWAAVERAIPVSDQMRRGDFTAINAWRQGEHLVEGLDALDARHHAAGDGRAVECEVLRGAFAAAISELTSITPWPKAMPGLRRACRFVPRRLPLPALQDQLRHDRAARRTSRAPRCPRH
jgi:hypothetical protein